MKNIPLLSSLLFILLFAQCNTDSSKLINGDFAPGIKLPNPQGEEIGLEQYQGKIVLIDFWASWCKPCREAHPKLITLFNKYHEQQFENADGFEIYSVSLDVDKEKWIKAIKKDGLKWDGQVSELKGWQTKAAMDYQLESIPASFLIDQKGMIIGVDLRIRDIDRILETRQRKK